MMGASTGAVICVSSFSGMKCNYKVGVDEVFVCGCARYFSVSCIHCFKNTGLLSA